MFRQLSKHADRTSFVVLLLHNDILGRFDAGSLHYTGLLRFQRTHFKISKNSMFKGSELSPKTSRQFRVFIVKTVAVNRRPTVDTEDAVGSNLP